MRVGAIQHGRMLGVSRHRPRSLSRFAILVFIVGVLALVRQTALFYVAEITGSGLRHGGRGVELDGGCAVPWHAAGSGDRDLVVVLVGAMM